MPLSVLPKTEAKKHGLYLHGIQDDTSDFRVHVCFKARRIYWFPTANAVQAANSGKFRSVPAKQKVNGVYRITALGFLIPPMDIDECKEVEPHSFHWARHFIGKEAPILNKARAANALFRECVEQDYIRFPQKVSYVSDVKAQIAGDDFIVSIAKCRVQVKCDYDGGSKELGGTGNLYIQVAERNPNKLVADAA